MEGEWSTQDVRERASCPTQVFLQTPQRARRLPDKTMTAEGAYQCFFETCDNLEDNRQKQRLLLKQKYFESFDNDTKRMLKEKSKVLRWVVDKIPDLQDIEDCRAVVVDYRKDTLPWYNILDDSVPIENELVELEKKLKSENLSDSETDTVRSGGTVIRKAR